MKRILVINPNSNVAVTEEISRSLSGLAQDKLYFDCVTLHNGPPGVENQQDVGRAASLVVERVSREPADAYVIACFSDPGVLTARAQTNSPVIGIGEASALTAVALGERFGVIAILEASVCRQRLQMRSLGIESKYVGSKAVGLTVKELSDQEQTFDRLLQAGVWLRDKGQADVIILGCAGMARYCAALNEHLNIPVLEPCRMAGAMAIGIATDGPRERI